MDYFGDMRRKQKVVANKRKSRALKRSRKSRSQSRAVRKPVAVNIGNYSNPVTLSPPKGTVLYMVTNRTTGRKNYYNRDVLMKLIGRSMSNYQLLMANAKTALFVNPYTRGQVRPRNIQRVTRR
jgi:hypothetical protein